MDERLFTATFKGRVQTFLDKSFPNGDDFWIRKLFLPTLVTTGRSSKSNLAESFFNLSTENQAIEDEEKIKTAEATA